jgi:hypothetical protein
MTGPEEVWVPYTISAIGITLNIFAPWPLLSMSDVGATGIYQAIADTTGIVFVRYGPTDTLEKYIGQLGGMYTDVSVVSDTPVALGGREARRVTLRMVTPPREVYRGDMSKGIAHRTVLEERIRICVIAFSNRAITILAGYRIPEESFERYAEHLENMLNSI